MGILASVERDCGVMTMSARPKVACQIIVTILLTVRKTFNVTYFHVNGGSAEQRPVSLKTARGG